jgi:hypothetical protein
LQSLESRELWQNGEVRILFTTKLILLEIISKKKFRFRRWKAPLGVNFKFEENSIAKEKNEAQ